MRGIQSESVTAWLSENIKGVTAPFEFTLIAGGHSNLTFKVTDAGGREFVLRRPPMGHVLESAHDMAREHRLITAVGTTAVPVPETLGLCTDISVNEAPFYVMDYVDGLVLDSVPKAETMTREARYAAGIHLIDVLADLHAVDVDEVGLGDLARRDGYIERQLKRWSKQWAASKTRDLPPIEEVEKRLRADVPEQQSVAIVHGDYRFGNLLTDPKVGRIKAVLDWELCTLGDPLADVGYLGIAWTDDGGVQTRPNDPTAAGGFPSYAEIVNRYAEKTGRDVSRVAYYTAFSMWRLAVISEGVYARYLHGQMADENADIPAFKLGVEQLADGALAAVNSLA